MGRLGRWAALAVLAVGLCCRTIACSEHHQPSPPPANVPVVRVRLEAGLSTVAIRGALAPTIQTATQTSPLRLNLPPQREVALTLVDNVWQVGGVAVPGTGELTMWQADDATVAVNGRTYRGTFRFVPMGGGTFDVVNDVDIDSYVKSVVPRELYRTWGEEAYKAQAIVARTYALHEARTNGQRRYWDVYDDQRSQVYGGYADETSKSRSAVEETAGVVVAYGSPGEEKIFKAYFSACCGGVTQSAADAFGENYFVPLSDQNLHGLCNSADNYNWGPVEIRKDELTARLRTWGARRNHGVRNISGVGRVEIQTTNRFNRPIRFVVIDNDG